MKEIFSPSILKVGLTIPIALLVFYFFFPLQVFVCLHLFGMTTQGVCRDGAYELVNLNSYPGYFAFHLAKMGSTYRIAYEILVVEFLITYIAVCSIMKIIKKKWIR